MRGDDSESTNFQNVGLVIFFFNVSEEEINAMKENTFEALQLSPR